MSADERVLLGHGAGGRLTGELVRGLFLPALANPHLATLSDAAVLPELPAGGRPALTTDAFVVDPLLFPGGDLGYLSVCGTVNDLAVAGAVPRSLTWALILEEGLPRDVLERLTAGAAKAARQAGVQVVAGDTKVVPRGKADGAFAVTAGLGVVPSGRECGDEFVRAGDRVVVSGSVGDHGATVMAARHGLGSATLRSDCAPLRALVDAVYEAGVAPRCMHDPTRGGLATTLNEVAARAELAIELDEAALPIRAEVAAVCELLGLDPLYLACEGRAVFVVAPEEEETLLAVLRDHELGQGAAGIGRVTQRRERGVRVVLRTAAGGLRPLDLLSGMDLPRIC
ncbi:MAG: hydrogenase expression/formation protein HypE [Planctomycetes bacterium]|nr:hydrogenase expression/formation protein HypE [Planctomycetota bacterium]